MIHYHRTEVPRDAIVIGPQAKEIDQRIQELAMVGVGGCGVVVAVLAIVFDFSLSNTAVAAIINTPIFVVWLACWVRARRIAALSH